MRDAKVVAVVAVMVAFIVAPCAGAPPDVQATQQPKQDEDLSFSGHKVLRVVPTTDAQIKQLHQFLLERRTLDVWQEPSSPGRPVDLRVCPKEQAAIEESLQKMALEPKEMIADLGSLITEEQRQMTDSKRANAEFGWENYQTLDDINKWLKSLAQKHPEEVSVVEGGQSYEGRKILGVKLKFQENAPIAFVEAGIHAREWITPAAATYLINDILTREEPQFKDLVRSYEWHIFPSTNPDGYVYTHTSNRLWRKTRSKYNFSCYGADPNRNWPFHWREVGSSYFPCGESYAGVRPESEPETQGLRRYLDAVNEKGRVLVYISVHSYSQLLMFPWGWTSERARNHDDLNAVAAAAVEAAAKRYGTHFIHGSISKTIYPASGNTVDYAYSKGVKFAYAFELRDKGQYGFLLPKEQIKPSSEETTDAIEAIVRGAKNFTELSS